jgi:hypothetical protein
MTAITCTVHDPLRVESRNRIIERLHETMVIAVPEDARFRTVGARCRTTLDRVFGFCAPLPARCVDRYQGRGWWCVTARML